MPNRVSNWHQALTDYLMDIRRQGTTLEIPNTTCIDFAVGAVKAQTSWHHTAPLTGQYRDLIEAAQLVRDSGKESFLDMVSEILPEIPVIEAQRGDIVAIPGDHLGVELPKEVCFALGVADPPAIWCLTSKGLSRVRLNHGVKAFRVG